MQHIPAMALAPKWIRVRSVTYSADIPFARDDARGILPMMVACLVGFVCLLLSVSVSLSSQASKANAAASNGFQVVVPLSQIQNEQALERIIKTVETEPGVQKVALLDHAKMQNLLKPWLGENLLLNTLGVPLLLEVSTKDGAAVNTHALQVKLKEIDQEIAVQAQGPWQRDINRAARTVHVFLLGLAALLIGCVVGMVSLLSRTALKLHFKTVSLLHLFGATDDYIAKQFERNSARLAFRGAMVGVGLAIMAFIVLTNALSGNNNPLLPNLQIGTLHIVLWLFLPIFVSIMAMLAARFSVQRMLGSMH